MSFLDEDGLEYYDSKTKERMESYYKEQSRGLAKQSTLQEISDNVEELIEFMENMEDIVGNKNYKIDNRVLALTDTYISSENIVNVNDIPPYISDTSQYEDFGITEPGWYAFARIIAKDGIYVDGTVTVTGADGYVAKPGNNYIDVAVRFNVAATSKKVTINWGDETEAFVFQATNLAIRNLDYRVTFYVYDVEKEGFVKWDYKITTDAKFVADTTYFTLEGENNYVEATVTTGEDIPAYYVQNIVYNLTTDATFAEEKNYYTYDAETETYSIAGVVQGENVEPDKYYEQSTTYERATGTFEEGVTYYTLSGSTYTPVETESITIGDTIPVYYVHDKVTFEGVTRNITYVCNTPIDCPMTFILPEIEDETHGCWFEIRCLHKGSYSMTLVPPEGVKVATEHTQQEQKGINMINLHYTSIAGTKVWRFMNTRSSVPA